MRKSQLPWSWSRPKINSYKIFLRHSVDISLCGPHQTAVSALPRLGQMTELISWITEEVIHVLVRFKASVLITKACDSNALLGCTMVTPWQSLSFLSWALFHHLCARFPELGFLKELFVNVMLLTSSLTLQLAPGLHTECSPEHQRELCCILTSPPGAGANLCASPARLTLA